MAAIATLPVVLGTGIHSARPAASAVGKGGLYSCTTHGLVYQTDGSSWTTWATLGTAGALTDPMTTRGDMIIRNASNVTARLAKGSATQVLTSDGTDIAWAAPASGTPTFHGARVYNNAAIAVNPSTTLTFNTERYDTDAYHDTGSNTGRLTIPTGLGGKYLISVSVEWAANATGFRAIGLYLNGTTYLAFQRQMAVTTGGEETRHSLSTVYAMAQTDYVEVVASQTSGESLNVTAGSAYSPEFSISFLGA